MARLRFSATIGILNRKVRKIGKIGGGDGIPRLGFRGVRRCRPVELVRWESNPGPLRDWEDGVRVNVVKGDTPAAWENRQSAQAYGERYHGVFGFMVLKCRAAAGCPVCNIQRQQQERDSREEQLQRDARKLAHTTRRIRRAHGQPMAPMAEDVEKAAAELRWW